jgi:hypothetical protein
MFSSAIVLSLTPVAPECYHRTVRSAILCAFLLASCTGAAPRPQRPLRDFRGIIHCHSRYSHDSKGTYEEILAAAKAARVDFICITDHPPKGDPGLSLREGWRGLRDGVLFIQGHELAGANLLAIGIREPVQGGLPADRIKAIRAQGGVAIVSHPEEVTDWEPYLGADGMEIYNVHAALKKKQKEDPAFLLKAVAVLQKDPDRAFGLLHEGDPAILARWDEINRTRRFVGVAGNDAHQNVKVGALQLDPYERAFRFVSTHVMAEELSERAILEGLRLGRCSVRFEEAWPDEVEARLVEEGRRHLRLGTTATNMAVAFEVRRDGAPFREVAGTAGRVDLPEPGVYRVTFGLPGLPPWYLSNGFRVRP